MSFTDQQSRIATEADLKAPWAGGKNGKYFRCYLCGHKFKVGDRWRFVFVDKMASCIVCESCDGTNEEVQQRWKALYEEFAALANGKFWYFTIKQIDEYKANLS